MSNPLVCAVMLTADRQAMTDRAVRSFLSQTYRDSVLWIYNTGKTSYDWAKWDSDRIWYSTDPPAVIGALRNRAIRDAVENLEFPVIDILAHWDSDDVSAPERLAGQVALLKLGYDAVGYNEMLFWDRTRCMIKVEPAIRYGYGVLGTVESVGEAWLYKHARSNYIIGTSLMYWRKTWEQKPFEERNAGEDQQFVKGLNAYAVPGFVQDSPDGPKRPAMIAEVHGSNTHLRIVPEAEYPTSWKRTPEFDEEAERIMKL